jgi:hypothetical protein
MSGNLPPPIDPVIARAEASTAALRHMERFPRTGNGLLIWRAYMEFRRRGVEVPEWIFAKFDDWAYRLESASGARAIAEAIGMSMAKGGASGAAELSRTDESWRSARRVKELCAGGKSVNAASRQVASELGKKHNTVRQAYIRWYGSSTLAESETWGPLDQAVRSGVFVSGSPGFE